MFKRCTGERANERVATLATRYGQPRRGRAVCHGRAKQQRATPGREPRRTGPPRAAAQACYEQAVQSRREQPRCKQPRCALQATPGPQAAPWPRRKGRARIERAQAGALAANRAEVAGEHATPASRGPRVGRPGRALDEPRQGHAPRRGRHGRAPGRDGTGRRAGSPRPCQPSSGRAPEARRPELQAAGREDGEEGTGEPGADREQGREGTRAGAHHAGMTMPCREEGGWDPASQARAAGRASAPGPTASEHATSGRVADASRVRAQAAAPRQEGEPHEQGGSRPPRRDGEEGKGKGEGKGRGFTSTDADELRASSKSTAWLLLARRRARERPGNEQERERKSFPSDVDDVGAAATVARACGWLGTPGRTARRAQRAGARASGVAARVGWATTAKPARERENFGFILFSFSSNSPNQYILNEDQANTHKGKKNAGFGMM
jgi:hypothetical protein